MNNQFLIIGGLGVAAVSVLGWWWWQREDPWQGRDTTMASSSGGREGGGHDPAGAQFRPRSVTRRTNGYPV